MQSVGNLEIHVVHSCNLACQSCSHYSDQGHRGAVSLEQADEWMSGWSQRINPTVFSLVGGEPTIHPELPRFIPLVRRHWPHTSLRLVTNGFFLHRHPTLPRVLRDDPDAMLYVSIHHDAPEYQQKLRPIVELVDHWMKQLGVRAMCYQSHKIWTRRYHGIGSAMEPFEDGQPRRSWENCTARYCPQLFEGKLWKCGALAYLPMQDAKHHLSEKWRPYLQYRPLEPGCSDAELQEFFRREEESFCGMCAAEPKWFKLPVPLPQMNR